MVINLLGTSVSAIRGPGNNNRAKYRDARDQSRSLPPRSGAVKNDNAREMIKINYRTTHCVSSNISFGTDVINGF